MCGCTVWWPSGGVSIFEGPSRSHASCGHHAEGHYVRGLELRENGKWLKLDPAARRARYSSQYRREEWIEVTGEDGEPNVARVPLADPKSVRRSRARPSKTMPVRRRSRRSRPRPAASPSPPRCSTGRLCRVWTMVVAQEEEEEAAAVRAPARRRHPVGRRTRREAARAATRSPARVAKARRWTTRATCSTTRRRMWPLPRPRRGRRR